jgi:methylthioribose-1-phosphate isomerase
MDASADAPILSRVTGEVRPVFWKDGSVHLINQSALPAALEVVPAATVAAVAAAIKTMVVRGAPAIGAAGAWGIVLAAQASAATTLCVRTASAREQRRPPVPPCCSLPSAALLADLDAARAELDAARPTAVNLSWVRVPLRVPCARRVPA